MMTRNTGYLLLGVVFGFALSQVRASEYDAIYGMFTGTDLTLAWVMLMAIAVGHAGMRLIGALKTSTFSGEKLRIATALYNWKHFVGSALFGIGWALSGACPGTVLAQLGEGKVYALFTIAGLMSGTWLYALLMERQTR